jgi:hypothetical protein
MTNTIKYGGYVSTPGGDWATSRNIWYQGDPLPGSATNADPKFVSAPTGKLPSISSLMAANLTATCSACSDIGSPLHGVADVLRLEDQLNASNP